MVTERRNSHRCCKRKPDSSIWQLQISRKTQHHRALYQELLASTDYVYMCALGAWLGTKRYKCMFVWCRRRSNSFVQGRIINMAAKHSGSYSTLSLDRMAATGPSLGFRIGRVCQNDLLFLHHLAVLEARATPAVGAKHRQNSAKSACLRGASKPHHPESQKQPQKRAQGFRRLATELRPLLETQTIALAYVV